MLYNLTQIEQDPHQKICKSGVPDEACTSPPSEAANLPKTIDRRNPLGVISKEATNCGASLSTTHLIIANIKQHGNNNRFGSSRRVKHSPLAFVKGRQINEVIFLWSCFQPGTIIQ